jgi:WD40 repeat protein
LAFSADGSRLVAGGDLGRSILIAPRTGDIIARLDRHDHSVQLTEFSADGSRAITSSLDASVSVWDARLSDRALLDEKHPGPPMHSFMPRTRSDRSRTRKALAHRNNTASIVRVEEPQAEIVHLKDIERDIEDIGFVDSDEMFDAPNVALPPSWNRYDLVWTSGRAGVPGIAIWDVTRSRALLFSPLVAIAAALSNGIGKLAGNERDGILFRDAPDDLYAEVFSMLTERDRVLVSEVAEILRQKQHPGCYGDLAP